MRLYLYVVLGGGAGAALRYWLSGWIPKWAGTDFPWGILSVNIIGCFFIGLLSSISEQRFVISPETRVLLTIGLLGGFTTFSTFSYETLALLRSGESLSAALYVLGSVGLGLGATHAGMVLGKLI